MKHIYLVVLFWCSITAIIAVPVGYLLCTILTAGKREDEAFTEAMTEDALADIKHYDNLQKPPYKLEPRP